VLPAITFVSTLRAVGDEDLVGHDVETMGPEVMLGDRFPEELMAGAGAVPAERLAPAHLVDGLVHGLDRRGRQRLADVADPAVDDPLGARGVGLAEGRVATRDLREEIPAGEFQVVLVDKDHRCCRG
jgi:hypothetical protein